MRGCVSKRASGTYSIVVELGRNAEGKRRQKSRGGFRTKKEAQEALNALLAEVQGGTYVKPRDVRLADYLREWLEAAAPNLSGKTVERYRIAVERHLIPAFGQLMLPELRPVHIQRVYSGWMKPGPDGKPRWARATLRKHHFVLHRALRDAVRLQYIAVNPADGVEVPRINGLRTPIRVLTEEQTAQLLRRAQDTRLHLPILLAVTSGLRRGELLAVRWSDLDLEAGVLRVEQSVEETGEGLRFKPPKTAKGRRRLPLPALTVEALRRHRVAQDKQRLLIGAGYQAEPDLVFAGPDGRPWFPSNFERTWRAFKLKLPAELSVRFHDLRHTHASQLLAKGVHAKIVSERLGHASIGITLDTYSHMLPGLQEDAVRHLEASLAVTLAGAC
jgi:integrase